MSLFRLSHNVKCFNLNTNVAGKIIIPWRHRYALYVIYNLLQKCTFLINSNISLFRYNMSFTVFDLLGMMKISIVYAFMSKTYPQKVPFGFIRKIVINIGICPHSFTEPFTIVSFGWLKGIFS